MKGKQEIDNKYYISYNQNSTAKMIYAIKKFLWTQLFSSLKQENN